MNEKVLVYINTEIQLDYGLHASGCIIVFIQVTSRNFKESQTPVNSV